MKLSLFASVVALLTASLFAPTLPAPAAARMRTGGNAARERREDNTSPSRSAACAVRSLREALSHVQIEHDFEVSVYFSCMNPPYMLCKRSNIIHKCIIVAIVTDLVLMSNGVLWPAGIFMWYTDT